MINKCKFFQHTCPVINIIQNYMQNNLIFSQAQKNETYLARNSITMNLLLNFFLIILLFCRANCCRALAEDKLQLARLTANSADLNQQTHRGEYYGQVQFDQGNTHLRAIQAVTQGDKNNKLIFAEAKGNSKNQAHYWSYASKDKPPMHAYANLIRYYPKRHLIELIGNAKITQGENYFQASTILYDTEKQHVLSKNDDKQPVTIVFNNKLAKNINKDNKFNN